MNDAILRIDIKEDGLTRTTTPKGRFVVLNSYYPQKIRKMLLNGKNWVGICTGRTRSGKSYSMLTLCLAIDKNFTVDNVVFSAKEFMDLLRTKKLKEGSMILWDEAGVGIATREWYSILNKSINYILQTWGYQNIGLVLTVPHFSFVDSQTRKLCNAHIKTLKLSKRKGIVTAKIHDLSPLGQDETKYVRPRYRINGKIIDSEYVEFVKPPAKLVHAYEQKKKQFSENLQKSVQIELIHSENKQKDETVKIMDDEQLIKEAWEKLKDKIVIINNKRKLSLYLIRKTLGVTVERARFIQERVLLMSEEQNYPRYVDIDSKNFESNMDIEI